MSRSSSFLSEHCKGSPLLKLQVCVGDTMSHMKEEGRVLTGILNTFTTFNVTNTFCPTRVTISWTGLR